MEAELQDIQAAVEPIHDKADRRGVHGHICEISGNKEPAADIGGQLAEAVLGKGKFTAGLRVLGDHIGIAESDDYHDKRAEEHSYGRSCHSGIRQEFLAGVNEGSPADDASERDRPDVYGIELALECWLMLLFS